MMESKLLSWQNIHKRGRIGPSICLLCRHDSDTIDHICWTCVFSRMLWDFVKEFLRIDSCWKAHNLEDWYKVWYSTERNYKLLHMFLCCNILIMRNIFENQIPNMEIWCFRSLVVFKSYVKFKNPKSNNIFPHLF